MNRKHVLSVTGRILQLMSILLLLPTVVSIIYGESSFWSFIITSLLSLALGLLLRSFSHTHNHTIYAREGFLIVALAWLSISVIGALPFVISGEIPSFIDALFETVSGFTTTGASILKDVESLSYGMHFWRSFTHWIGGMGILVFIVAFLSNVSDRSMHILKAEMPGPLIGKLTPRAKDTSKILYVMYIFLTLLQIILLVCGDMNLFESIVHTFGSAGTGGFGIKSDSIASYSPYSQWVIAIFITLFGINFNLYYLILVRKFKSAAKSTELHVYLGIILASTALIVLNILPNYNSFFDALRDSFFQVTSIMTTTGYTTTDFNLWPSLSKAILFLLMMVGACAGSTGGGLKVSRVILLFKMIGRELKRMLHPRAVVSVRFEGKVVDESTQHNVASYFAIYIICLFASFLVLSLDSFDFETNLSAVVACFNNIGPGFGAVGPASSYADYSILSKLALTAAMLLGRLEIFPLLIVLAPSTWTKK